MERRDSGFSLLELIVAMALFLIVTGAIYGLLQLGTHDRNRASRRSDIQKNARVAVHLIGRDVLNAGLAYHRRGAVVPDDFISNRLRVPVDADTDRDILTSIVVGDNINPNNLNAITTTMTDTISFAYRDMDFNGGNVIDVGSAAAGGGSPAIVRLTSNTATGAAAARLYDVYLVESDTSQVAVMATGVNGSNTIDAGTGDPLGLNQRLDGIGVNRSLLRSCSSPADTNCTRYPATARKVYLISYKVDPNGTLIRVVLGNNTGAGSTLQIQEFPLAYNIEDLQIRYVLDDGSTVDNPATAGGAQEANRIRQVQISLTVQATEIDQRTGRPESITLTGTFSTRNLGYDAS